MWRQLVGNDQHRVSVYSWSFVDICAICRWCTDTSGYDNTAPDWEMGGVWGDQPSWFRCSKPLFNIVFLKFWLSFGGTPAFLAFDAHNPQF